MIRYVLDENEHVHQFKNPRVLAGRLHFVANCGKLISGYHNSLKMKVKEGSTICSKCAIAVPPPVIPADKPVVEDNK